MRTIHTEEIISNIKEMCIEANHFLSPDMKRIKVWKSWYPEANRYISENTYISGKNRMLQEWASRDWWLLVQLYNFMFNKIIYGIIYR